ncbi:MAG: energy transducer TonB [Thermodesulfobacteriota bacterium]
MKGSRHRLLVAIALALLSHLGLLLWRPPTPQLSPPYAKPHPAIAVSLTSRPAPRPVVKKTASPEEAEPGPRRVKESPPPPPQPRASEPPHQQKAPQPLPPEAAPVAPQPSPPRDEGQGEKNLEQAEQPEPPASAPAAAPQTGHQQALPLYHLNPPPTYPRLARRRGLEGVVLLNVHVNTRGRVETLTVERTSGHPILDRAARKAVMAWQFQPGQVAGLPRAMWVTVPVRFQLR